VLLNKSTIAVAVLAWLRASQAWATPAFETYPEQGRPEDADRLMVPLRDALFAEGVGARPRDVVDSFCHVPRPAATDPTMTGAAIADELEVSVKHWLHNANAVKQLSLEEEEAEVAHSLKDAFDNTGAVAGNANAADAEGRALIALALIRLSRGNQAGAEAALLQYVRGFDQVEVSRDTFGPKGIEFVNRIRKKHEHDVRGKLIIAVTAPDANIFINDVERGRGAMYDGALLPGDYRVVIRVGGVSRRYDVTVSTRDETRLSIDWALESRLFVSDLWVGIVGSAADDAHQRADALALQRLVHCKDGSVITLSVATAGGKDVVSGTFFDTLLDHGHPPRTGWVELAHGAAGGDELRHLARYLVKGDPSPDVRVDAPKPDRTPHPVEGTIAMTAHADSADRAHRSRIVPGIVLGVGAVGLVAGGVMIGINQRDDGSRPYDRHTEPAGIGIGIGGAAVIGLGLFLWFHDGKAASSTPTIGMLPGGGTVGWAGSF